DITAWSRTLAMGLPLIEATAVPAVAVDAFIPPDPDAPRTSEPYQPFTVDSRESHVAWVLPATSAASAAAALRLRRDGFLVHCARKPFTAQGREYHAGAFVVRGCGQPGLLDALAAAAAPFGGDVEIVSVPTLW